jgi:hypothetical protein
MLSTPSIRFLSITWRESPLLPFNHTLVLNTEERIITLIHAGQVAAQCRCSQNAFRLFFLLLHSPLGADYVELLACLHCPESVFRKLLAASPSGQMFTLLAPYTERWQKTLERIARADPSALEKELKIVRRAAKERHGANTLLKKHDFPLRVNPLYRKGYVLVGQPSSHARANNETQPLEQQSIGERRNTDDLDLKLEFDFAVVPQLRTHDYVALSQK